MEEIEEFVKVESEFKNDYDFGYYSPDYGYISGDDFGYTHGYGSNNGIKSFNKEKVYYIDSVPTIIRNVRDNIAQGFILQSDFTLIPCFIAKERNIFAHGKTIHEVYEALQNKLFDNESEEVRIKKFKEHFLDFSKKHPAKELFHRHHILTGSCKVGRLSFCHDKGIDVEKDQFTVYELIKLTENSYNGDIIKKLL